MGRPELARSHALRQFLEFDKAMGRAQQHRWVGGRHRTHRRLPGRGNKMGFVQACVRPWFVLLAFCQLRAEAVCPVISTLHWTP